MKLSCQNIWKPIDRWPLSVVRVRLGKPRPAGSWQTTISLGTWRNTVWTDLGLGDFELRYLRDKQQREVDFLVVRDGEPWFLVEAKHQNTRLSGALDHFQRQTQAAHAFQVVETLPFVHADPYAHSTPRVVPARTLLSQWL
ncbi:MAG: hypothetical protein JJU29_13915 [Verrucomicrobia bacterium]|nr:hypothetical protein [Verrucomicrobiota bacterium]